MPDIVLHNEMATRVLERLDKKILIRIDVSVFRYGVMAPDAYMSYRFFLPHFRHGINRRGAIMHEKKCGDFLIGLAHNCHDDKDFSILCGFICHFALDSTLHPLINQLTVGQSGMHEAVEHALDMMVLRKKGYKSGYVTNYFSVYYECASLANTMKAVYGWGDDCLKTAYNHQKLYYQICCDRFGLINLILKHCRGKLSSLSYNNTKCNAMNLERLDELINESIELAVKMINAASALFTENSNEEDFVQLVKNRNYLGQL